MLVRKVREWKIAENYTRKMERHKGGIKKNVHKRGISTEGIRHEQKKKNFYPKNGHTFAGTNYILKTTM